MRPSRGDLILIGAAFALAILIGTAVGLALLVALGMVNG